MSEGLALGTKRLRAVQIAVGLLLLIVIWSIVKRFALDMPHLAAGTMPAEDEFDRRYVEHAWLAYLHIVPGTVYLLLAPLQLAYRVRTRHYTFHRRLGRVLATAGMISGVFALIFSGRPDVAAGAGLQPVRGQPLTRYWDAPRSSRPGWSTTRSG